jgi:hypothetical protein
MTLLKLSRENNFILELSELLKMDLLCLAKLLFPIGIVLIFVPTQNAQNNTFPIPESSFFLSTQKFNWENAKTVN